MITHKRIARVLFRIGSAALMRRQVEVADEVFTAVRALAPDMRELDLLPATGLMMSGRFDEAAMLLQHVPGEEAAAMMAACQIVLSSPDWQTHAEYLIERGYLPADAMLRGPEGVPSAHENQALTAVAA